MGKTEYPLSLIIRAVDQATATVRGFSARLNTMAAPVRKLNTAFAGVGREAAALTRRVALMATAAGYGLYRITKSTIKVGDDLATVAKRVGLSVDAFAQLRFAAMQSDVEMEQFTKGMDYFNKTLGESKAGTGALTTLLKKSSPALLRQLKGTKSVEEALTLMTSAMVKIKDPSKRAALAAAAFGRSGQQIGVWLSEGGAQIDEMRKKYADLVGSQKDFAKQSSDLDNALRETEMAFEGLRSGIATGLFPAFGELSRALTRFLVKHRTSITAWAKRAGDSLTAWIEGGGLQRLGQSLSDIASSIAKVVDAIGGLRGVAIGIAAIMSSKLIISVLTLGKALVGVLIPALRVLIPLAPVAFRALTGPVGLLLTAAVMIYARWKYFKLFWQFNVIDPVMAGAELVKGAWADVADFFSGLWDSIAAKVEAAIARITGAIQAVRSVASGIGEGAKSVAGSVGNFIASAGHVYPSASVDQVAAARSAMVSRQETNAKVTVDFANVPRGVSVQPSSGNTAPLDLSLGYSMVSP